MANTQNLNFDDGFMSFQLNNDPNKVIRFNPTDFGMIKRLNEAFKVIDKAAEGADGIKLNPDGTPEENIDGAAQAIEIYDKTIKDVIDGIFNSNICDIAFGKQSPLSIVGGGKYLWESFLECICKEVEKETNTKIEASHKRVNKYKKQVFHG